MLRPFRFATSMPSLTLAPSLWRDRVRRIEDLGFSSVAISDHVGGGWAMDPFVAMTVAAEATTRLRVLGMVFCNDLRHPTLVHKSMANLDVFSGGRVEMGLGAGWDQADYEAIGRPFDPPAVRIARLAEAAELIIMLFADNSVTYSGAHYQVVYPEVLPKPVQRPRPPLAIGGGGQRVLEVAGRFADIVGINPRLGPTVERGRAVAEMSAERLATKVGWVRDAARAAGRDPDLIELQMSMLDVRITHQGVTHRGTSSLAAIATEADLAGSLAVLRGSVDECVDRLTELRERFGISYIHVGGSADATAPVVARLAGT